MTTHAEKHSNIPNEHCMCEVAGIFLSEKINAQSWHGNSRCSEVMVYFSIFQRPLLNVAQAARGERTSILPERIMGCSHAPLEPNVTNR